MVLPGSPAAGPLADAATPRPPWVLGGGQRPACRPPAGIATVRVDPRAEDARGPSSRSDPAASLGARWMAKGLRVGRRRGSQPCAPIPEQKTLGAPRRARDPAASLGARWMAKGLRVGRRRGSQARVVDPRQAGPLADAATPRPHWAPVDAAACRPPAATASSRCRSPSAARTGPLANEAAPRPLWTFGAMRETCVSAAWRGSQARVVDPRPWAGAPRRRSDPATTSTPRRRRRERTRSAGRAGDPTRGTARCP